MSLPQRCLLEGVWDLPTGAGRWRDKSNKQPKLGGCFPLKTFPSHGDCQAFLITVNKKLLISMSSSLSERNNPKWVPLRTIVAVQSGLTPCEPMDCIMPGFPGLHCRPEFAQTHVHWVDDDAVQHFEPCGPFLPSPWGWTWRHLLLEDGSLRDLDPKQEDQNPVLTLSDQIHLPWLKYY